MRSIEGLSHHPSMEQLAKTLRPEADAKRREAVDRVITPEGRVRLDRTTGFIAPDAVPLDVLERGILVDLSHASFATMTVTTLVATVPGARENDAVLLGPPSDLETGLICFGRVSADDTVTIRVFNGTAGSVTMATKTWRIVLTR